MWQLFGVFIVGLSMGGLAFLTRRLSRNRLPSWIVPAAAGLSMLGFLMYYDYSWYEHKLSLLPEGSQVIDEKRETGFLRPWSYVATPVSNIYVFDGKSKVSDSEQGRVVEYFIYEFIQHPMETQKIYLVVLNCNARQRAILEQGKTVQSTLYQGVGTDDPLYRQLCQ